MSKKRILVVDDDRDICEAICDVLADEGFDVRCVLHGLEALSALKKWRPDLILMDIIMPNIDGMRVASIIRQMETLNDIPIVLMTAGRAPVSGDLVLNKPFQIHELIHMIQNILGFQDSHADA